MKILIAVSGTGGHVYPGIALAEELRSRHPDLAILFAAASGRGAGGLNADPAMQTQTGGHDGRPRVGPIRPDGPGSESGKRESGKAESQRRDPANHVVGNGGVHVEVPC